MRFYFGPETLSNPLHVFTLVSYTIVCKRDYRKFPISISHKVTVVELHMLKFDVNLVMDWIYTCYA